MTLRWKEEAELEFSEAAVRYFYEDPGLDERFINQVERTVTRIIQDPFLAREFLPPYRKVQTKVFPFQVIYTIEEETIWIVAVMHQSRKPGYWEIRRT